MIHKISSFRIYAAIDYSTEQIYSMEYTIPSFPHNDFSEVVNLSKKKINRDWETSIGISWANDRNIIISNTIKIDSYGAGFYRLIERDLRK